MIRSFAVALLLFAAPPLHAGVIELKTGQRVEGTVKQPASVSIEVGGQTITFEVDKVRAIYFGAGPAQTTVAMTPVDPVAPLRALASATKSGVTYRDYATRVVDTRVRVDEAIRTAPEPARGPIVAAMRYHELASKAWNYKIREPLGGFREIAQAVETDETLRLCPAMAKLLESGNAKAAELKRTGEERLRVVGVEIAFDIPSIWACASDKIAEAEKLLGR
jgi:hypothetical protein